MLEIFEPPTSPLRWDVMELGSINIMPPDCEATAVYDQPQGCACESMEIDNLKTASVSLVESFATAAHDFILEGKLSTVEEHGMERAVNPCLSIEGVGQIGSPMGDAAARAIISVACPVVLDDTADIKSHIWEVAPDKIRFENPEWDTFQKSVGHSGCKALAGIEDVEPILRLSRLILHEAGSAAMQQEGRRDYKQSDPVFGTLIILLPSLFEGGKLRFRYDMQSNTYDLAHGSGLTTSVLAIRDIADCELSPVTAGYRLSLVYDILQPTTATGRLPRFPAIHGPCDRLKAVLLSWKQSDWDVNHLEYLLQNNYPYNVDVQLDPLSLKGNDAVLLSHTRHMADELGLELYLAHFSFTTHQLKDFDLCSSDDSDDNVLRKKFWSGDGMGADPDWHTSLQDMEGNPMVTNGFKQLWDVCERLVEDDDEGHIGWKKISDYEAAEEGNRTLERSITHERVVVVVLDPSRPGALVRPKSEYSSDSRCGVLDISQSHTATDEEKEAVDSLVIDCRESRIHKKEWAKVITSIQSCAVRWSNVMPLLGILKACRADEHLDRIDYGRMASACRKFGWKQLSSFLEKAIQNDTSNSRRQLLLNELRMIADEDSNAELRRWCDDQEERVLRSLRRVTTEEIGSLLRIAVDRGWNFLKEIVFPQLSIQNLGAVRWTLLLQSIQTASEDDNESTPAVVDALITESVTQIVDDLPTFTTTTNEEAPAPGNGVHEGDIERIMQVIQLCIETGNPALCTRIARIVRLAFTGRGTLFLPLINYAKLCRDLEAHLQSNQTPFSVLKPFFVDAVDSMLATCFDHSATYTKDLSDLVVSLRSGGGISFLKERIVAHHDLFKTYPCPHLTFIGNHVVKKLKPMARDIAANRHYSDSMSIILGYAIQALDLTTLYPTGGGYTRPLSESIMKDIATILEFCFDAQDRVRYIELLVRLLPAPPRVSTVRHLVMFLAPFLSTLYAELLKQTAQLQAKFSSVTESFSASVIKSFATRVMCQGLTDGHPIQHIGWGPKGYTGCSNCKDCKDIRQFFLNDQSSIFSIQRNNAEITHLSGFEAQMHYLPGVTVKTTRVNSGCARFQITKPENLAERKFWSANSSMGKTLLALLGDVQVQRRVLGDDFDFVHSQITVFGEAADRQRPAKLRREFDVGLERLQELLSEGEEPPVKRRRLG
ncbi:hypothetical protein DFH07DRAFT_1067381 [Mycena maculata]|uniref:Uncharacterized protein n=1 Tax=Mycena maculata TaxID=230809 RepID=A0AAD7HK99_9AGAR|nr:hypothetical protein DFH07DRAFT_1067381 [Mycena maculata]